MVEEEKSVAKKPKARAAKESNSPSAASLKPAASAPKAAAPKSTAIPKSQRSPSAAPKAQPEPSEEPKFSSSSDSGARRKSAEAMAERQRDISFAEFFTKNRHLLGFDSPLKGLLTAVKEAVDNSLDACEEAGILPEILVEIVPVSDASGAAFDPANEFRDAPKKVRPLLRRDANRKQDAWWVSPPVRELACLDPILNVLRVLYRKEPIPFQTLNFLPGTEQGLHSDVIHFSSIPARFMCGVWVALEDATSDNGPLRYVPGSHRLDEIHLDALGLWAEEEGERLGAGYALYERFLEALVEKRNLPVKELHVKKGGALVWAANLLHGGAPIRRAGTTRRSQVTHYYFEDCVHYTPVYSNPSLGEIYLRRIYDIRRGKKVEPMLHGETPDATPIGGGRYRLARPQRGFW